MNLELRWHKPLSLRDDSANNGIYTTDLNRLPDAPGIYILLRVHGQIHEALYVGKANCLCTRVPQQFNNVKLMKGIENAARGSRKLAFAEFIAKKGQQQTRALKAMENALIRYYLALGNRLLNIHGARIVKHSLSSERSVLRKFIPITIYFEK
jgi:hypothetical protein